jgi:hypothetical protein
MGISCALTWTTFHKGCSSTDQGGGKRRADIVVGFNGSVTERR